MNWIYKLNWWYDDQNEPKRFILFFLPLLVFLGLIYQPWSPSVSGLGLAGLCGFALLRLIPFAAPRKRPRP
jgi:hypothetical protein